MLEGGELKKELTVEAGGSRVGNYDYGNKANKNIYELWRIGQTTQ